MTKPEYVYVTAIAATPELVWKGLTIAEFTYQYWHKTRVESDFETGSPIQFFAREAIVDARIDGEYSVHFFPDNPPGSRGAEHMRIVAIEPPNHLLFTWNSPTFFGPVREQRALVEVFLEDAGQNHTRLTLRHFGWGRGEKRAAIRKYFDGGWRVVLDRLECRYANGPIDWNDVPENLLYDGRPKES